MKRKGALVRAVVTLLFFCLAPTAGDIGSCSQAEDQLDPVAFFGNKQEIDCGQCQACAITTRPCDVACAGGVPVPDDFPKGCVPLVHDGEVCLDALVSASCGDYTAYMAEEGASTPSECDFCPVGGP